MSDSKTADAEKPEAPVAEPVLSVGEDRANLAVKGACYLVLDLVALGATAAFLAAASFTGNPVFLLLIVVGLTCAWFLSKAMGQRFGRLMSKTPAIDFCEKDVVLYPKADPKKRFSVTYKDIKNYKLIRQGKALRLLLSGEWVEHPSGFWLVDISRPFMADTLDDLERDISQIMREKRVNERK